MIHKIVSYCLLQTLDDIGPIEDSSSFSSSDGSPSEMQHFWAINENEAVFTESDDNLNYDAGSEDNADMSDLYSSSVNAK